MNGRASIRGYVLQALSMLLEVLQNDSDWISVAIEPDDTSEKIDILWRYPEKTIAVQVKSSQNHISLGIAKKWAKMLTDSRGADSYELILIGPYSPSLLQKIDEFKMEYGVKIPPPKHLNILDMLQQAAHRLDHYLESRYLSRVPALVRELLIEALLSRLTVYSTSGEYISRDDFDLLLREWILAIYPHSIEEATKMECDLLTGVFILQKQTEKGGRDILSIVVPIELINSSNRTTIIEWIAIRTIFSNITLLYRPLLERPNLRSPENEELFREFAVPSFGGYKRIFTFIPDTQNTFVEPKSGDTEFEYFIKYRDRALPELKKRVQFELTQELLQTWKTGAAFHDPVALPKL